jgi:CrcB protein
MVGICGGFTTFSAFSLQTLELLQTGDTAAAMLYIAASVVLCLAFVWFGWYLGRL